MRAHDGDMFDDEEGYEIMPPFSVDRPIWHGVTRSVEVREDTAGKRVKCSVVVTFTRVGYNNSTQERITERVCETVVADNLTRLAAADLKRTVDDVCSQSYATGYADRARVVGSQG